MSSEMQDRFFPNLGIVRNMKPTVLFLYSIPGKAYQLRHIDGKTRTCLVMSPYHIKAMKYEPTQSSIYLFVCYQFDIYFHVGSIDEESTEELEEKKTLTSYN